MKLLIATSNAGKTREMSKILKGLPVEIVNLKEFADIVLARETGESFVANARIKAKTYYRQTGLFTLAEDSGLQVDYLNGDPGYRSARFAGTEASDDENLRELLKRLRGVKAAERTARFVSVMALTNGKKVWIASGKCHGRIALRPSGSSGFGYDPVFIPEGYNTTFARMGTKIKNEISHRAEALAKSRRILERLLAEYPA